MLWVPAVFLGTTQQLLTFAFKILFTLPVGL